jgi:hypothetical protein
LVISRGYEKEANANGSTSRRLVGVSSIPSLATLVAGGLVKPVLPGPPKILVFNLFNALNKFPIVFLTKYYYNYLYENARKITKIQR